MLVASFPTAFHLFVTSFFVGRFYLSFATNLNGRNFKFLKFNFSVICQQLLMKVVFFFSGSDSISDICCGMEVVSTHRKLLIL